MQDYAIHKKAEKSANNQVIVCADDYGLSPGISKAIRELIATGRITATSCMSTLPEWRLEAKELADLSDRADIGLHFTLTNLAPISKMPKLAPWGRLPSLTSLMRTVVMGRLPLDEVRQELEAQLDAFESAFGRTPDYLDSHHHVHTFPTIRTVVVDVFSKRLAHNGAYLRCTGDSLRSILSRRIGLRSALFLNFLAGPLRLAAQRRAIPYNEGFTGLYYKSDRVSYQEIFPRFLKGIKGKTILLCHPGELDAKLPQRDKLLQPRAAENRFFSSQCYLDMLAESSVNLSRFRS